MKSAGVLSDVKYIYQIFNNLTERQCNDSQIVAFQAQYRNTDQETEQCGRCNSDQKRQEKSQAVRLSLLKRDSRLRS